MPTSVMKLQGLQKDTPSDEASEALEIKLSKGSIPCKVQGTASAPVRISDIGGHHCNLMKLSEVGVATLYHTRRALILHHLERICQTNTSKDELWIVAHVQPGELQVCSTP